MEALRYFAAILTISVSGAMLLGYYGLAFTSVYELPSHPVTRMVICLTLGLALPFLSARLMTPSQATRIAEGAPQNMLWRGYPLRLFIAFAGALFVAVMLAYLEMELLDGGVI